MRSTPTISIAVMLRKGATSRLVKGVLTLVLAVCILVPLHGPLQIIFPTVDGGTVLSTLNVCESGGSAAHFGGQAPYLPGATHWVEPCFSPTPGTAEEEIIPLYVLLTSIFRPPRIS